MSRATRLLDLVQLLDSRFGRTRDELVGELGVSERTLYRDIASLGDIGIPVLQVDGRYRLVDGAAWHPVLLSPRERATLRLVLGATELRAAPELARRLSSLAAKLTRLTEGGECALVFADRERTGPIPEGCVERLEDSVARQATVEMDYVSLTSGGSERRRRVDPWALFHRDDAWYLVGRCHQRGGPRIFRLDRIRSIRQTGDLFLRPPSFNVDEWLSSAWSLYQGGPPREIVIHFAPSLAPLIENAKHHEKEEVTRLPDGAIEYRVTLTHIEEIARWIAGFGGRARAVEPEELVEMVREMARNLADAHDLAVGRNAVAAKTARGRGGRRKSKR